MAEYQRPFVQTLLERLAEPPQQLIAIFGPRQAGKTTGVRQALESQDRPYRFEAADEPDGHGPSSFDSTYTDGVAAHGSTHQAADRRWLIEAWQRSRAEAWGSDQGAVLVLDEIQKAEGWSEAVKGLWDADRASGCPLHVVLLGSAPMLMQAGLTESLVGRFEPLRVTHWSYTEMRDAFGLSLDEYIYFGGYPGAVPLMQDQARWVSYIREALISPTIELDVLAMRRIDKPALLRRLFDLGCEYSGQPLAYGKMVGYVQDSGSTDTAAHYLKLLSDVGLLAGLPKHTNRRASPKRPIPKLNVLNTALMAATSGYTFEEARADRSYWGRMVESAVGAHLLNSARPGITVKYWRHEHYEVDFALSSGPVLVGVEVKSGRRHARIPGPLEFERRFGARPTLVVGSSGIEMGEFLSMPAEHWMMEL